MQECLEMQKSLLQVHPMPSKSCAFIACLSLGCTIHRMCTPLQHLHCVPEYVASMGLVRPAEQSA